MAKRAALSGLISVCLFAGMNKNLWPRFAVMNGLAADAVPPPGRPVKVVR